MLGAFDKKHAVTFQFAQIIKIVFLSAAGPITLEVLNSLTVFLAVSAHGDTHRGWLRFSHVPMFIEISSKKAGPYARRNHSTQPVLKFFNVHSNICTIRYFRFRRGPGAIQRSG